MLFGMAVAGCCVLAGLAIGVFSVVKGEKIPALALIEYSFRWNRRLTHCRENAPL